MTLYGYHMEWSKNGGRYAYEVKGYEDAEEAMARCVWGAWDLGWRPAKWWQFWKPGPTTAELAKCLAWVTEQYVVGTNGPSEVT